MSSWATSWSRDEGRYFSTHGSSAGAPSSPTMTTSMVPTLDTALFETYICRNLVHLCSFHFSKNTYKDFKEFHDQNHFKYFTHWTFKMNKKTSKNTFEHWHLFCHFGMLSVPSCLGNWRLCLTWLQIHPYPDFFSNWGNKQHQDQSTVTNMPSGTHFLEPGQFASCELPLDPQQRLFSKSWRHWARQWYQQPGNAWNCLEQPMSPTKNQALQLRQIFYARWNLGCYGDMVLHRWQLGLLNRTFWSTQKIGIPQELWQLPCTAGWHLEFPRRSLWAANVIWSEFFWCQRDYS